MKIRKQIMLFSCILIALSIAVSRAEERNAYVKTMIGSVKVRKGQSPIWKDGRQQMVLHEKDAIRTFVESQAEIMTAEGTVFKLGENTTLELSTMRDFGGQAQSTRITVLSGTILANVKKLVNTSSSFDFETPTAVASIRGTTLGIDVTGDQTTVKVYEGEVVVKPKGSAAGVSIKSNEQVTVVKGQKTLQPQTISEKDKNAAVGPDTTGAKAKTDSTLMRPKPDTASAGQKPDSAGTGLLKVKTDSASAPLQLSVTAPADNSHVKPGAQIMVAGRVVPASAKVLVSGGSAVVTATGDFKAVVTAGLSAGDFEIDVDASNGSQSQSATRKYTIDALAQLFLQVTSPPDGQKFNVTVIPVAGMTTPGATVSVSGIQCQVGSDGSFSGRIPIPEEENQMSLDFEAVLGNQTQDVSRKILYQPTLTMTITSPQAGQLVNSTTIQVAGQVLPSTAELTVYDTKIPVSTNGNFIGTVTIPDNEGQVTLDFDANYKGTSTSDSRTVTYKRAVDQIAPVVAPPSMPLISQSSVLSFTVLDQTPDDEEIFYKITDGSKESESGRPNSSFNLNLEQGIHTYTVYAEDLAHNLSNQVSGTVTYLSQSFVIQMRKPLGTDIVRIPPPSPASSQPAPQYTVEFSILNVPNDDRRLIKQVSVTNLATHKTVSQVNITDLDMEFDVDLQRGSNPLSVDVLDILNRPFSENNIMVIVK